jgi:hypothetical protein
LVKFKGSRIALSSQALIDEEALEILKLNSKISIPKKYRDLLRDQQPDEKSPDVGNYSYVQNPWTFFAGRTFTRKIENTAIGSDRATHILTIKFGDASTLQGNRLPVHVTLEPPHPCLPNGSVLAIVIKNVKNPYSKIISIHASGGVKFRSARRWGKKSGISTFIVVTPNKPEKYYVRFQIAYWPLEGGTNMKLNFTGLVQDD